MNKYINNLFSILEKSYLVIVALALAFGLLFPEKAYILTPFSTLFLQIIFFLTSLKIDARKILKDVAGNIYSLIIINVFMLLLLPAVIFFAAQYTIPYLALPLLLLAAMPSGMTTPLLTEVVGGKTSLALVLTLTTSLLAPLTIPLVMVLFAKTTVIVSAATMVWSLTKVILIPFILAQVVRYLGYSRFKYTFFTFKPISIILLGLLIAGAVADQAYVITNNLGAQTLIQLGVLFLFTIVVLAIGYFTLYKKDYKEKITIAVSLAFMNFTLAIYIAINFFNDPVVLLSSVLIIFPWALMLTPFKLFAERFLRK